MDQRKIKYLYDSSSLEFLGIQKFLNKQHVTQTFYAFMQRFKSTGCVAATVVAGYMCLTSKDESGKF